MTSYTNEELAEGFKIPKGTNEFYIEFEEGYAYCIDGWGEIFHISRIH